MSDESTMMSIWEHVGELRRRLLWILVFLALGVLVNFGITQYVLDFLAVPVGGLQNLQSIEVTENIGVFMRVSLLGGFILAFPFIIYQIIAFIMPGLKGSERKWIYLSIPFAFIMFVAGVAFAYFIMLPAAVPFLIEFLGVKTTPRLSNYMNFVTNLMFWIGISFETPLLIFILAKLHLVTPRSLFKGWKIAVVISAVLAAFITPTVDPVNMALLMAPLMGLYFLSIILSLFAH